MRSTRETQKVASLWRRGGRVSHHGVARPEGGLHRVAERHDLQEADVWVELELAREEVQAVRVRVLADARVLTVEQSGSGALSRVGTLLAGLPRRTASSGYCLCRLGPGSPASSQCAPECAPGINIRGAKVGTAGLGGAQRPPRRQARLSHMRRAPRTTRRSRAHADGRLGREGRACRRKRCARCSSRWGCGRAARRRRGRAARRRSPCQR